MGRLSLLLSEETDMWEKITDARKSPAEAGRAGRFRYGLPAPDRPIDAREGRDEHHERG